MKKLVSIVLIMAVMTVMVCTMVGFDAVAAETTSLLPANASDFTCVDGGDGSVTVTKEGSAFKFSATGGWPQAYYTGADQNAWPKAYINQECYLNWDFEVKSGAANVIVFFCGQSPADQAGIGVGETINYLIDPTNNNLASGATVDLPVGTYKGSIHVKDLGCREDLILSEGGDAATDPNAYFTVSGMKVFAVGGDVVVNDLSIGAKVGDAATVTTAPTTDTTTATADTTTAPTTAPTEAPKPVSVDELWENMLITLTADKGEYAADEPIKVTLTAENLDLLRAVPNVRLESVVPQGYQLKAGSQNTTVGAQLQPGATVSVNAEFVPNTASPGATASPATTTVPKGTSSDSPKTGDISHALFALILAVGAAAVMVATYKTGRSKQMLSLALCLTLSLGMAAALPTTAEAAEAYGSKTLLLTVKVNGTDVTLTGTVSYGNEPVTNASTVASADGKFSCTFETPEMPIELKHVSDNDKTLARYTIQNVSYKIRDNDGYLTIYFDVEKTYDAEGAGFGRECLIAYKIYDGEDYIVQTGQHNTDSLREGDKVRESEEYSGFEVKNGETYRIEFTSVKGESLF